MFTTNAYLQYPYNTLKLHVYNQCLFAITLHKAVTITLILLLLILLNKQDQVPCNTFILFFPDHFRPLRALLECQLGSRCSHVSWVW
jgi:hypothetical protein